ncbi:hypothetical protein DV096_00725 [Bradymonadaceae bacterium TMQ3]|uniref:SRPBCC domain-containing protein n=1 Tax=Lujinxingia sediminis TaxID=2480984 RepID=A0ABY0CY60_9DELT|nr:hypothetical protein [Lujinxingia sediminis]RDV39129.1 hypothetical protein DV096_00725 [Bradymonadaceae bacterium TMQ3]RVU48826.1 hypothetical protein EA187_05200 [Lujinxingia sediminis]TXC78119.1 hypothetical protein FRC91_05165 [Bradymonadales bacterium TMQ1]
MTPPKMSDDAVQKATGHPWRHWFDRLDALGAESMSHKDIAHHLHTREGVSGWWAQSITVAYERARGMREIGETSRGFQISKQKTFLPDASEAWTLLTSAEGLGAWLGAGAPQTLQEGTNFDLEEGLRVDVRGIRPGDSIRLGWIPSTRATTEVVIARVETSPSGKGTIGFTHENLPDADARESARSRWTDALKALQTIARQNTPR